MPNLNISGNWTDFFWVYAAMAYPLDERQRNEFVASSVVRVVLDAEAGDDDIEIPSSILRVLLNAPDYENIASRACKAADKGAVAGDVLDYIAQMHFTGYKQPSVRKAIFVAEEYLSYAVNGLGEKGGSSNIFIYDCWGKYKTVAHLWAAFRVCQLTPNENFPKLAGTLFGDELGVFLAIAEKFRRFGESFIPPVVKSRETLLPQGETWKVPESYSLPDFSMWIQEMPWWMAQCLNEYSKRNS